MGNLDFDASTVEPNQAFDPLPPGWYVMVITKAEIVDSEKAGEMLKVEHEIDEMAHPDHKGRKVWSNLCINHPNQKPREIARRTLSAICHSADVLQLTDTDDLLGKSLRVKLKAKPAEGGYDARNEVSGYKAIRDDEASEPAPVPAKQQPKTAAAPAGKPAWKR